jgi:hypothetical protein
MGQHLPARGRRDYAAGTTREQTHPEVTLEACHGLAHLRRRHTQFPGSPGDGTRAMNREQRKQVGEAKLVQS